MAYVEKIAFPVEGLRGVLRAKKQFPLPPGSRKLLEHLAERENEPLLAEDAANFLRGLQGEGMIPKQQRISTRNIVERAISVVNNVLLHGGSNMRVSYIDRARTYIRANKKRSRSPRKVAQEKDDISLKEWRANVAHGLYMCQQFGCDIAECKDDKEMCEFKRALRVLDGHSDENTLDEEKNEGVQESFVA